MGALDPSFLPCRPTVQAPIYRSPEGGWPRTTPWLPAGEPCWSDPTARVTQGQAGIMNAMSEAQNSKPMDIFVGDPRLADTDLVIVAAFEGDLSDIVAEWSAPTRGEFDRAA